MGFPNEVDGLPGAAFEYVLPCWHSHDVVPVGLARGKRCILLQDHRAGSDCCRGRIDQCEAALVPCSGVLDGGIHLIIPCVDSLFHYRSITMGIIHLSTIGLLIDIFAAAILVTAVLIVSSRSLVFYIRLFALQSFFLGAVALLVVLGYGETHILIAAFLTIAVKAIAIPMVLTRVIERIQVRKEIEFSINITASLLLCAGMVILSDSVAQSILSSQHGDAPAVSRVLSVSIAMMLIGLFIMMTRKKA